MKLWRIVLLVALVAGAGLLPATASAGEPPKTTVWVTRNSYWLINEGSQATTGNAFHSWDWTWGNDNTATDPRLTGEWDYGSGRCDCTVNSVTGELEQCTCHSVLTIKPTGQPGYWQGVCTSPVKRQLHCVVHGFSAFDGLTASFDALDEIHGVGVIIGR